MPLNFKTDPKVIQLAMRTRLVMWAAILIGLWLLGVPLIYNYFQARIRTLSAQNQDVRTQIQETKAFIASQPDMDQVLKSQEELLKKMERKILRPGEHARVVSAVAEAAKAKGIVLSGLKPVYSEKKEKARQDNKRLLPTYFELEMPGRYQQVGEFFEHLETLPLSLSVVSFDMSPENLKPGTLHADITLAAYEAAS